MMIGMIPLTILVWYAVGAVTALVTGLVMGLVCLLVRSYSGWLVASIAVGGVAGGWLLRMQERTQFDWQAAGVCAVSAFVSTLVLNRFESLRPHAE